MDLLGGSGSLDDVAVHRGLLSDVTTASYDGGSSNSYDGAFIDACTGRFVRDDCGGGGSGDGGMYCNVCVTVGGHEDDAHSNVLVVGCDGADSDVCCNVFTGGCHCADGNTCWNVFVGGWHDWEACGCVEQQILFLHIGSVVILIKSIIRNCSTEKPIDWKDKL